jgi:fructose-bisphosphate aldolase class 1
LRCGSVTVWPNRGGQAADQRYQPGGEQQADAVAHLHAAAVKGFFSWGWRLPFLFSVALVLIALWIRNGMAESQEFEAQGQQFAQPQGNNQ